MKATSHVLHELGQAALQVLGAARKMAARGDALSEIESYLRECRGCFLSSIGDAQRFGYAEVLEDISRALRYASPDSEMLGALVVVATLAQQGGEDLRCFALSAHPRIRAEIRDHARLGVCDPEDIRLGAELALHSIQPLIAA